ncbi:MAG: ABC transporter ATP-binding protein [Chloroflexi bacterium GWB2_49_20]|nr:MAG: ABC transporter ATP-binding protein [Chloroflexi bacterium GWB2_49_20]OGN79364.1 MAG: ABC transporter ATP-binding protein [Chloroflexi bacterium GWC2_49_37]OGN82866.1 MAG: ABC transporter ATP-binding protein [Chloroflexi bacterium GWD2_49_16]HCC78516.1 ABC transporter ATP-binding protein [Anaerolineae bacterium]HCM97342.1 ABC transporter ATP-binding protein [Anaerolineae bacterium]
MISLVDVSKTYEGKHAEKVLAVKSINLDVQEREFITIVGPSGCGKSTLLNMIVGLLPITSGKILFNDELVVGPRKDVGMVFQRPLLLPWRNILQNVLLPIEILGRSNSDYQEEALKLLELVGLSGFENKSPWELSGGMQQRASICRALIHDPTLIIMDEPFGALDAMTRDEMGIELLRIWQERQKTVLFVTHSIREAVLLADKVIVLTARPCLIQEIVKIDLPRPRTSDTEFTTEYDTYVKEIRKMIYECGGKAS